jgi:hypothetical protein
MTFTDVQYYSGFTFDAQGHELLHPGQRVVVSFEPERILISRGLTGYAIRRENVASVGAAGPTEPSPMPRETTWLTDTLLHRASKAKWSVLVIETTDGAEGRFIVAGVLQPELREILDGD